MVYRVEVWCIGVSRVGIMVYRVYRMGVYGV